MPAEGREERRVLWDAVFCFFMRLLLNGNDFDTGAGTIGNLLDELSIAPERVAVEVNLTVIKKPDYPSFAIKEGDRVEIINFVGGG